MKIIGETNGSDKPKKNTFPFVVRVKNAEGKVLYTTEPIRFTTAEVAENAAIRTYRQYGVRLPVNGTVEAEEQKEAGAAAGAAAAK